MISEIPSGYWKQPWSQRASLEHLPKPVWTRKIGWKRYKISLLDTWLSCRSTRTNINSGCVWGDRTWMVHVAIMHLHNCLICWETIKIIAWCLPKLSCCLRNTSAYLKSAVPNLTSFLKTFFSLFFPLSVISFPEFSRKRGGEQSWTNAPDDESPSGLYPFWLNAFSGPEPGPGI